MRDRTSSGRSSSSMIVDWMEGLIGYILQGHGPAMHTESSVCADELD